MVKLPSDPTKHVQPKPAQSAAVPTKAAAAVPSEASAGDQFARTAASSPLFGAANAIAANAARGIGSLGLAGALGKDVAPGGDAMRPDLGLGAKGSKLGEMQQQLGGEPNGAAHPDAARFPKLPSNRDAGGSAGSSADALRPSMDPSDWISGSRGKDFTGEKTVENLGGGVTRTTYDHGDGTSTIVTEDPFGPPMHRDDGSVVINTQLRSVEERNPNGSGIVTDYIRDLNGPWLMTSRRFLAPGEGINRTLDPDAAGGPTILPPNVRIDDPGLRDPNRYEPSGETNPGTAPRLDIDTPSLAGDPSLREGEIDLERLKQIERWKVPGCVLPPRPGSDGDSE